MAFGIDVGPSSGEQSQYGSLTSASGFATNVGEEDLLASSRFMQAILSGDASKITQALAPQISAAKTRASQDNKTAAQMTTRSGGTAASTAATNDKVHSDITSLIGGLTGTAASSLGSEGSGLLSTGISGDVSGFGEAEKMQQQRAAKWNDLFNSVGSTVASFAGIPGIPKGVGRTAESIGGGMQDIAWGY